MGLFGTEEGNKLFVSESNSICSPELGYVENEDVYITFVYKRGIEKDKLEYYINGELFGWTWHSKNAYNSSLEYFGSDECNMFVGVCPWGKAVNLFYLKGKVYGCRLYETDLSAENVKKNYDATVQFRNSGL